MAISQKKANEVEEEEYEEFEEMEIEEEVEDDDYEEAFEEEEEVFEQKEEDLEEEEIEQSEEDEEEIEQSEEDEEDEKKVVKVEEEEESVKESAMKENTKVNRKQLSESDLEQNDEEEEMEPSEEDEEIEQKIEEEESVKESAMEENKKVNRKQLSESDVEQNDEEEEEEIEPIEEDEEIEQKIEEEEESVKESAKEENKTLNRKQPFESDEEQNEEDEEEEIEPIEEEDEKTEQKIEEDVKESAKEENKTLNPKKPSESDIIPFTPLAESLPLLQSINDLEKLHCALSKFLHEWNSLSRSLESISSSIDKHASLNPALIEQKNEKNKRTCVEIFCEEMNGKALRKYIESNVKDINRLRNEVSEALKRVPNPEKLVLDAIGKFYTQGRKAYDNSRQLVMHRRTSILLLEFFLLSGRANGDNSVRVEANHGAVVWWKRLVNENVGTASVEDCLGFVLFLACFGISMVFASRDLCFLLLKSDLKKKISVLRRSSILVEKIPGIIKDLIRGEMYYEAAELSCFFELTDTFPPLPLLSSLVARVIQAAKVEREKSPAFPNLVRQADSWELTSLRSVVKFLEYHKFGTDSLDSVHIHKRISELENCIDGDAAVLLNNIRKRKVRNHATGRTKSRARSKKSFPSTQKTPQNPPSQMIQNNPEKELPSHPLLPENSALSAAVWERTYFGPPASFRSSAMESKTLQNPPSEMIQKKPEIEFPSHLLHPNSDVENSAVSVAGWGSRAYLESLASYRSSAMECSSGQQFYQRQALGYGNGGGGLPGRDLYKFADTVEAQLSKSRRSSNTSPGGAKFGYY